MPRLWVHTRMRARCLLSLPLARLTTLTIWPATFVGGCSEGIRLVMTTRGESESSLRSPPSRDGTRRGRRCRTTLPGVRTQAPVPIAIRGGGHSYAGYGVADGAIQIDLATFTSVTVPRRVGRWGHWIRDLLKATLAEGLYTPMGSCGSVGVVGLTLAGGDTRGRGLYGTACDNLIGAQLVTADGDVRQLGSDKNEDLYWAIRGGGGNFGVVTRLDFRLHPIVPLHSATFNIGWRDIAGALSAFGDLVLLAPDEARASFTVDPQSGASVSCGYFGDAASAAAYLRSGRQPSAHRRRGCPLQLPILKARSGRQPAWP